MPQDDCRIIFDSNRKEHRDLYQKASSGAGSEEVLVESGQDKTVSDWSSDGRFILYQSTDPQTSQDIWALTLEGDRKPFVFLKTNFNERLARFSPDGRWVAYSSDESGRYEVYARPFQDNLLQARPMAARAASGRSRPPAGFRHGGRPAARNCITLRRMEH